MNFRELLTKYKNGTATEAERKLVEQEIEKYEAMEEYISESFELDFKAPPSDESRFEETIKLKKSVNNRLRKVVMSSVAIVMVILLSVFYIISPMMDGMYYNPSKTSVSGGFSDLYFDVKVFTELNLPGYALRGSTISESLGFGNYNVYFNRSNLFTQEGSNINAKIKRNMRIGSYEDFFGDNFLDFGFWIVKNPELYALEHFKKQKERVMSQVQKLNPVSYISAYITFERDITLEEYTELSQKYPDLNFKWLGVRTSPKGIAARYITGFNPNPNDGSVTGDGADHEKYPYLQLVDWFSAKNPGIRHDMAEGYKLHYLSLLRFMADRKATVTALDHSPLKSEYYQSAIDYVEKNGIQVFGVLVYADAEDFIEFAANADIKTVELDSVLASRRYVQ